MSRETVRPYVDAQLVRARAWRLRGDYAQELRCLHEARSLASGVMSERLRVAVWLIRARLRRAVSLLRFPACAGVGGGTGWAQIQGLPSPYSGSGERAVVGSRDGVRRPQAMISGRGFP